MKGDYFIYTGNAYPHKNLERLIDAMITLNKSNNVKLKISSSRNVFTQRLEKIIKEKQAGDFVELLGYVSDNDLPNLYKNSIAFVFPTLSEGFGLPPKEAIEAGSIAVVSNISVLKEVYGDSVFYFNPVDVNSMVVAMENVLKMPKSERKRRISSAQNFLKKYSWLKMAKQTLAIYESVV
jgi:glycosyltransferase involved in cell wall biosynthesis